MPDEERVYIAIDLKSFYASVECALRGLDPMTTHLVVADESRTEKTICLAVSPALKACGVPGRPRLFEVVSAVRRINALRRRSAPGHKLVGSSASDAELRANPALALEYIVAKPQMALYIEKSTEIYRIYTRYVSPEDIHVYSIDEVFMDVTHYLKYAGMTPRELAKTIMQDVLKTTGITATAGIGTNLYLCKIAMDIVAKHISADEDGVRIAELNEMSYRRGMWSHRPLTDFWRVGRGTARKLEANGLYTMGDIARCSLTDEERLYRLFGVNAELLIDHAWGWEPCRIADIKNYKPKSNSISAGQVLQEPYPFEDARLIAREMADSLSLDLVKARLVTDQIVLTVGYEALDGLRLSTGETYRGPVATDFYGRTVPKPAHGSIRLDAPTSSTRKITEFTLALFDRIVNRKLPVRRLVLAANHVASEARMREQAARTPVQLDMFTDYEALSKQEDEARAERERERIRQETVLEIKKKYGKNAIVKGMDLQKAATARSRNAQIGGHNAV